MKDVIIGVDLAKAVFQLHGAGLDSRPLFRKKLSRGQFLRFMAQHPDAVVAMEACGSAHYWSRELVKLGHEILLIPPQYVRPFVKRQKIETIRIGKTDSNCEPSSSRYRCGPASLITIPASGF